MKRELFINPFDTLHDLTFWLPISHLVSNACVLFYKALATQQGNLSWYFFSTENG
jgi:hypothetical protein